MTVLPTDNFATLAIHAGAQTDNHGSVIEPISLSTTYKQSAPAVPLGEYEYSRSSNPNRKSLEDAIAALESAKYGLAYSSGSAATVNVFQLLPRDSHVVSIDCVYGGTHRALTKVATQQGIECSFAEDLIAELPQLLRENTKMVWIESPTNPTLKVTDIAAVAAKLKELGSDALLVVDNTFMSPYLQNPLNFGADIVVHSGTKYINGHSDVVIGAAVTNNKDIYERLTFFQNAIGAIPSPFDCWLAHRGLKTLHLRAKQASINATKVAEYLAASDKVVAVNYPGLPSHENYDVVQRQHRNGLGGGMISFRIKGGAEGAAKFVQSTRLFALAESLGGIESLCEVPAVMTHAGIPKDEREKAGVFDDLIRLSVGIEDEDDLLEDVKQALEKAI